MNEIKQKIKEIIVEELFLDIEPESIKDDDFLLSGGFNLDSIAMIEILVKLEDEYNIFFEDFELTEENMVSINVIADLVSRKLSN